MPTPERLTVGPGARLAQSGLRALWYVVIPALLAGVLLRYAAPSPLSQNDVFRRLGQSNSTSPLVFALALFLGLAGTIRYWRFFIPGGRYLAALPPSVARDSARESLANLDSAYQLRSSVVGLPLAIREPLASELSELEDAILKRDSDAAQRTEQRLRERMPAKSQSQRVWVSLLVPISIALVVGAALLVRARYLQTYRVLSASMLPTLRPGEVISSEVFSGHTRPLQRGDIVVFHRALSGDANDGDAIVKRVIGVPGDHIGMDAGLPTINGWLIPHCDAGRYAEIQPGANLDGRLLVEFLDDRAFLVLYVGGVRPFADYVVKPGEVFVLGDNRNDSFDSRFWNRGMPAGLRLAEISGRVGRRLSTPDRDGTPNFSEFLKPIGMDFALPGVGIEGLKAGIEQCLKKRPAETHPPQHPIEKPPVLQSPVLQSLNPE